MSISAHPEDHLGGGHAESVDGRRRGAYSKRIRGLADEAAQRRNRETQIKNILKAGEERTEKRERAGCDSRALTKRLE